MQCMFMVRLILKLKEIPDDSCWQQQEYVKFIAYLFDAYWTKSQGIMRLQRYFPKSQVWEWNPSILGKWPRSGSHEQDSPAWKQKTLSMKKTSEPTVLSSRKNHGRQEKNERIGSIHIVSEKFSTKSSCWPRIFYMKNMWSENLRNKDSKPSCHYKCPCI